MRAAFTERMMRVALFAADEDSVLVRLRLRDAGVATAGAYVMEVQSRAVDLRQFLARARPDVVVYDYVDSAPRSAHWLAELRRLCDALGIPCVLSVRDVHDLHEIRAGWAACILVRPYDVDMARLAIHEAMRSEADDATTDSDDEERGEAAA